MEYIEVAIRDEFIRLGQAMKLAGILSLGSDIKYEIVDGKYVQESPDARTESGLESTLYQVCSIFHYERK